MAIECYLDDEWCAYRERIELSDGTVSCCETGIVIPAGFPYAHCQGTYDDGDAPQWESFHQALEVWRWARNNSHRHGHCLPFRGIDETLEAATDRREGDRSEYWRAMWQCLVTRIDRRYAEGKKPRLHPAERTSLESGQWVACIPYTMRLFAEMRNGKRDDVRP